jgi:hypothetical protein
MVLGLRVATTHMLLIYTTKLISNQLTVKNKKWQLFTDTQKMHSIWNQNCSWALKRCIQWFKIWPEYDPIRKNAFKSWLNLSFPNLDNPRFSRISNNSKNVFQRWIFATDMIPSLTEHSHPGLIACTTPTNVSMTELLYVACTLSLCRKRQQSCITVHANQDLGSPDR